MLRVLFLVLPCLSTIATARSASGHSFQNLSEEKVSENGSSQFWSEASFMYRTYQQCSKEDLITCLKVKLVQSLDKALYYPKEVALVEGIKFTSNEESPQRTPPKTEKEIKASLPRSFGEKDQALNYMIFNKIASFLESHTLQIKFPSSKELERSFDEERGKKNKKSGAYIMIPLLLGGTFIPIAYGALAMLAGKALIVSKLALVLASIIGIKKLLSGGGKESQHEVVVSGGHGGSGWGRDFDIAYSGYDPSLKEKPKGSLRY